MAIFADINLPAMKIYRLIVLLIVSIGIGSTANSADSRTVEAFREAENLIAEGDLDRSAAIIDSILSLRGFRNDTMYARVLVEKSTIMLYSGNVDAAKPIALGAAAKIDPDGDQIVNTSLWNNLAVAYNRQELTDSALMCYERALHHASRSGDLSWTSTLYCNLGVLYYNRLNYPMATRMFRRAVADANACDDGYTELVSAQLLTNALLATDSIDGAGRAARHSWNLALQSEDPGLQLRCIPGLVQYYEKTAREDSATYFIGVGAGLLADVPPESPQAAGFHSMRIRYNMEHGNYRQALDELLATRHYSMASPLDRTYRMIAHCYAGLGDYHLAYTYGDSAVMWTDSLATRRMEQSLAEFEVRYNTVATRLANRELQENVLRQRQTLLLLGLLLVAIAGIVVFLVMRQRQIKARMEIERNANYMRGMEDERRTVAAELHDGVAADLLALRLNLSAKEGLTDSVAMAERLRCSVRAISHRLMPPEFHHQSLPEIISHYARLISADGEGLQAEFVESGFPADYPVEKARELFRIFQEELSNIIRYCSPAHIVIALNHDSDGTLTLSIDHDGHPHPDSGNTSGTSGIGSRTTLRRLHLINATLDRDNGQAGGSSTITVRP